MNRRHMKLQCNVELKKQQNNKNKKKKYKKKKTVTKRQFFRYEKQT